MDPSLSIFTTCPSSREVEVGRYGSVLQDVARWSEQAGCIGALVYADNGLVDPWLVAQLLIEATDRLCPLVAVQPVYMHPYTVAKLIASLSMLHGRRIDLNLIAGGFRNDLQALGDTTPHDERYARLGEYGTIITSLLRGDAPVTLAGHYYHVTHLTLTPPLPPQLFPTLLMSGSSEAGRATARALGATSVEYPAPGAYASEPAAPPRGVRVGIVARDDDEAAWRVAHTRFPEDRRGRMLHALATKVSDSSWHRQLSGPVAAAPPPPYWLEPFRSYQTFCPYLVGSYTAVGDELRRYIEAGVRTFILDVPRDADDLGHSALAFEHAMAAVSR